MILYNVYEFICDEKIYKCSFVSEYDAHQYCLKHEKEYQGRLGVEIVYEDGK